MKNNKHVESFGQFNENLNISDVSDSNLTMRQLIIDRINKIYTKSSGPKLNLNVSDKELISLFENLLKRLYQQ